MPRNTIRRRIGLFLLNRRNRASKNVGLFNYRDSKKYGILYESIRDEDNEAIKQFIKKLKADQKEIFILIYILEHKGRVIHNSIFKTSITRNDLNFFKLPKKKVIARFLNNQFDVVINLTQNDKIYLHYISSRCKARLKIAPYSEQFSSVYDLMIDLKENSDPKSITDNIDTYLQMINKNTAL